MADAQTISIVFAGLSIGIAAIYYALTIRNTQRNQELALKAQEQALETRQAQLFMSIYNRFHEVEFWKNLGEIRKWEWESIEEYHEKYYSHPELIAKWNAVGSYFEGMGVMVKRNLIDVTVVDDLMSGPLMSIWQKWEPTILEERRRRNMPTIWEWYEYLYEEVRKVSVREHGAEHVVDVGRLYRPIESS